MERASTMSLRRRRGGWRCTRGSERLPGPPPPLGNPPACMGATRSGRYPGNWRMRMRWIRVLLVLLTLPFTARAEGLPDGGVTAAEVAAALKNAGYPAD